MLAIIDQAPIKGDDPGARRDQYRDPAVMNSIRQARRNRTEIRGEFRPECHRGPGYNISFQQGAIKMVFRRFLSLGLSEGVVPKLSPQVPPVLADQPSVRKHHSRFGRLLELSRDRVDL